MRRPFINLGIENRHYKVLENGDLKSLLALDNNGHQKFYMII